MVEFALAIPFLLLCIVAIAYFGKAFYTKQIVTMAAQEGAKAASRIPNLSDPQVRDFVKGFTLGGQQTNANSVVYASLASGRLLSQGISGDLPPGSAVKLLPWDSDGSADDFTPPGTVAVRISYPFVFAGDPFNRTPSPFGAISIWSGWGGTPIPFSNVLISERAVVSQEVYQEVN